MIEKRYSIKRDSYNLISNCKKYQVILAENRGYIIYVSLLILDVRVNADWNKLRANLYNY